MAPPLQEFRDLDRTSPQFYKQLSDLLRGDAYRYAVPRLQHEDLVWLIEYLDEVLTSVPNRKSPEFKILLHDLGEICGTREVLPKARILQCALLDDPVSPLPTCEGIVDNMRVRIRRVKIHSNSDRQNARKAFHQVSAVWKHLTHPNVAPLLGVTVHPFQLISDWVCSGDLIEYIGNHPRADRQTLLSDVAEGLNYLHSYDITHRGLRGSSVLVDTTGRAQVTDFGLFAAENPVLGREALTDDHHNVRWIAPEILDGQGTYSKESDIFWFAMVMIEVFSGVTPFNDKLPHEAALAIVHGERPPRPTRPPLTDTLWEMTQKCWDHAPHKRPQTLEILDYFGTPAWKSLVYCPLAMDKRISLIKTLVSDRKETEATKDLSEADAQAFVDTVDEILSSLDLPLRKRCLKTLCKVCGHHGLLPKSVQIRLQYDGDEHPLYAGGYGEVWKGEYQGREVAVKVLKATQTDFDKIRRRFCKEVMTWKTLHHPNVLPLVGVAMTPKFAMASEWMVNGNINEFVKVHKDADPFELLEDVARGLLYMHEEGMVHGDLKGANILIDQGGHACLADFGLITIISDPGAPSISVSCTNAGTIRWMSPELLDPDRLGLEDSRPTEASDCYALGMVILEVLSGQAPFTGYSTYTVMRKVPDGEHPERPGMTRFTDVLWGTLEQCWSLQPKDRPTIKAVLDCLKRVPTAIQALPSAMDENIQVDSSGNSCPTVHERTLTAPPVTNENLTMLQVDPQRRIPLESLPQRTVHPMPQPQPHSLTLGPTTSDRIQVPQDFPPITDADLKRLKVDPQLIRFIVTTVQRAEQSSNGEPQLSPTEAKILVEILDKVVSSNVVNPTMKNRCFRVLRKVTPAHGLLPKSYFRPEVTLKDSIHYASGGYADIWKGRLRGEQVCVKAFRTQTAANLGKIKRRFYRDIVAWKYVMHPNVVTFTGISETLFSFCIVYPWQKNGNILEYTRTNQRVNRLLLLSQAACGLDYLHSLSIVHSAINPGNILVDDGGNACLGDVGVTGIITDPAVVEPGSTTTSKPGVVRYMSPELLNPTQFQLQNSNPTKESDVYSLAMTAYQVLTDILPYGNARDGIIIFRVVTGDRPTRPQNSRWLQDRIWDLIIKCWSEQREERWDVRTVYNQLSASSIQETAQSEREAQSTMPGSSVAQNPPRQGMSAERVSIFVEDRGATNLPGHQGGGSTLPPLQTQKKPAGRKSGARSQTAPPPQSPASTRSTPKKHFTFPVVRSPKPVETEGGPSHQPRQRKLGFSFASPRRLRKVVNVILGILRLRRAAKTNKSTSG